MIILPGSELVALIVFTAGLTAAIVDMASHRRPLRRLAVLTFLGLAGALAATVILLQVVT